MFIKNQHILLLTIAFVLIITTGLCQCVDNGNYWSESWMSCMPTQNPNSLRGVSYWILFEFDEAESIDSTFIWNANNPGKSKYGVKEAIVDYSIDNQSWINLDTFQFPQATEQADYAGFNGPNFEGIFVKKILFTITDNYNIGSDDCVSISEIKFNISKDACYELIDACGICDGPGAPTWYYDADGDGLGDINNAITSCAQPANYVSNSNDNCDNGLLGWPTISAIFNNNGCMGCHGANMLGGLDLRSYETAIQGGNKCGPSIFTNNTLVNIITIDSYTTCNDVIEFPSMNTRTGNKMDSLELANLQSWIDIGFPENCYCLAGAADTDNDGFCDAIDICPNFDDALIGQPCNDGKSCTVNDKWLENCQCTGTAVIDSDNDGICDNLDVAPFNACTADGTVDGVEPTGWVALLSNDCDSDLINVSNNDINDFDACFDNFGQSAASYCVCANNVKTAGGILETSTLVDDPKGGNGLPDGNFTSIIAGPRSISLSYPNLSIGDELCFTVGFSNAEGIVNFDANFNSFSFINANGSNDFSAQQFCFNTVQNGFHNVIVTNVGGGYIKLDGSSYTYCECSENDPAYNTPSCNCKNSKIVEGALFNQATNFTNAFNANAYPDGIFTGNFEDKDTVVLACPNLAYNSEVCITLGFNAINGAAKLKAGNENFNLENCINDIYFQPQQFCYFLKDTTNQMLQLTNTGDGLIRIDGAYYTYCPDCDLTVDVFTNDQTAESTPNGSVGVNITGGQPPFTINWNTGETTDTLSNLYPGFYLVEVNDAAGCSFFETLEVEPYYCNGFELSVSTTAETSYYTKDGTAQALVTGGKAPFSYNWSVNQNDSIATNLPKGVYSLNVLDANGCSRSENIEIETLVCPEYYVHLDTSALVTKIYKVNNFIQTNGYVLEHENVLLKAPNYIQLNNNFEVKKGADFEIIIGNCQ